MLFLLRRQPRLCVAFQTVIGQSNFIQSIWFEVICDPFNPKPFPIHFVQSYLNPLDSVLPNSVCPNRFNPIHLIQSKSIRLSRSNLIQPIWFDRINFKSFFFHFLPFNLSESIRFRAVFHPIQRHFISFDECNPIQTNSIQLSSSLTHLVHPNLFQYHPVQSNPSKFNPVSSSAGEFSPFQSDPIELNPPSS